MARSRVCRSRVEVILEVLAECRAEPCDRTTLAFRCNLGLGGLGALAWYLTVLEQRQLIEKDRFARFHVTARGEELAFHIAALLELIDGRPHPRRLIPSRLPKLNEKAAAAQRRQNLELLAASVRVGKEANLDFGIGRVPAPCGLGGA